MVAARISVTTIQEVLDSKVIQDLYFLKVTCVTALTGKTSDLEPINERVSPFAIEISFSLVMAVGISKVAKSTG